MIGQLVGKYRIAEKIGEGGMGAVYRAEHVVLGSPAAIKVLLPQWTRNRQVVDRFLTEARAASAIRHVGIVQVFDAGRLDNGQAYIAMELLAGSSLADLLERRGTLTPPLALAVGGQILAALDAAHVVGVIHRDLKPDNIQLVRDPTAPSFIRVKLLDFGIAKLLFDAEGRRLPTAGGALLGTPSYMSPEQCAGHSVDARSDLYSVGCILFEMLTGQPPFYGDTSADIVAMHLHEPPPLLRSVDPTLSRELEQLVSRMLDKDPEERTPSAAWALAALERAVFDAPANAPTAVAAPLVLAAMSAGPPALPGGPVPLPPPASGQYGAAMPARPPGLGQYSAMSAPPASGQYGAAMPARPPASGQYGAAMPARPPGSGQYGAAESAVPMPPWLPPGGGPEAQDKEGSSHAQPRVARIPSMARDVLPGDQEEDDFHHIDTGSETAIFAPVDDTSEHPALELSDVRPPPQRPPTPMMMQQLAELELMQPPVRMFGPLPRAEWAVELPPAPPVPRRWLPYVVIAVAVVIAMVAVFLIAQSAELPAAP
ncbi:MAG: serine/threonine protein kinase [Myxococcales bacterium]|nr:serine/threonine protein kinase [Myxococcales bacterium]